MYFRIRIGIPDYVGLYIKNYIKIDGGAQVLVPLSETARVLYIFIRYISKV